MTVEIREHPFDPWQAVSEYRSTRLASGKSGASAVFVGTMRDFNEGDEVQAMVLEHYPGMTEQQLEDMRSEAVSKHGLEDALIVHRVGIVHPGDDIVLVAAFSAHRKEALAACREMMETLKSTAPFWKKETLTEGERWVERNTPGWRGRLAPRIRQAAWRLSRRYSPLDHRHQNARVSQALKTPC